MTQPHDKPFDPRTLTAHERLFVALDTPDLDRALSWAAALRDHVGGLKLGLEFYAANGPDGVRRLAAFGLPVFLDLKFHDIPNTIAGAVRAAAGLGVAMLNVHAGGGPAMLRAAVGAAATAVPRPLVLGVTVLTSLDDGDLEEVGQRGPAPEQAMRLAGLTRDCGLDGVVCAPADVAKLRSEFGPDMTLVVPGIRPDWAAAGDQKRIMTPAAALAAGADVLVIGRPITGADDAAAAARRIADALSASATP